MYAYSSMFIRGFKFAHKTISGFLDVLLKLYKFYSSILKEPFIEETLREVRQIRSSCKHGVVTKSSKGGFLNTLSGFLSKESSSEGEEVLQTRTPSNSLRIEAIFNKNNSIIQTVIQTCGLLS